MDAVGIRELANQASAVVGEVERTGQPVLVTRRGRPVAVVSAIDEDALYDFILTNAPEFARKRADADAKYERGEWHGRPLSEVMAELEAEEFLASLHQLDQEAAADE
jgi:prevent-host-death family protein